MLKSPNSPKFAGAFFKRLSRIACSLLMLLAFAAPLPAVDLIYVSLSDDTIVSYDVSSGNGTTIAATAATFANTNLNIPMGLAFDSSGNLYAANFVDSTISKFNPSGGYESTGSISSNVLNPNGLAFDSSGNLYASNIDSTISKFNPSGGYESTGSISSNLNNPMGLAFDSSGNLYAANYDGNTISKFNPSGGYVTTIGSGASLTGPRGLAFDSSGNLYAANTDLNTISKFDASGAHISTIGSSTYLNQPIGLAFDSLGNLYAANEGNNTISIFDSSGTFKDSWITGATINPRFIAFNPVPEPSTYALATIATGVMAYLARHRKARIN